MIGVELVVGYLIAWTVSKARRVGQLLDGEIDQVLDAGLDRLHEVVTSKLGTDPALADLHEEAVSGESEVSDLTRQRVGLAIQAAVLKDPVFSDAVARALEELAAADPAGQGGVSASGDRSAVVGGNADVRAENASAAAVTMGDVTLGAARVDPSRPDRSRD